VDCGRGGEIFSQDFAVPLRSMLLVVFLKASF